MARKDYYEILEVPNGKESSEAELRIAYKKACLKWHPDKNSQSEGQRVKAEKMFKEVNEAIYVLSDKEKRQAYDAGGDPEEILQGKSGTDGGDSDISDISEIIKKYQGGGLGGGFAGGAGRSRGNGDGQNQYGGMNFGQNG